MDALRLARHLFERLVQTIRLGGVVAALCIASMGLISCASARSTSPYSESAESPRDTAKAERLTREAIEAIDDGKIEKAEPILREALAADLFYGPAHNNLGVVFLKQKRLYEAAGEFEWARKLMPGHPDPRYNLGLTLERAGRTADAIKLYDTALEVQEECVPAMQAVARLALRRNVDDDRVDGFLEVISIRGETEEWRTWAQRQLALRRD